MPRQRKPLDLHHAHGSFRGDRHRRGGARPIKAPRPPAHLSEAAREKWRETARQLADSGLLTALDLDALEVYCVTWAGWRKAVETIEREGSFFVTETGQRKKHPLVAEAETARKDLLAYGSKLGLNPTARQNLYIEPATDKDDPISRFFSPSA